MTRVLVCGGRNYADYWTVFEVLDGIHHATPVSVLIEGGALGADRFARRWAAANEVPVVTVEADWRRHGRAAGPLRNLEMLAHSPDRVIAFPGGKGTANMVDLARTGGVSVTEIVE